MPEDLTWKTSLTLLGKSLDFIMVLLEPEWTDGLDFRFGDGALLLTDDIEADAFFVVKEPFRDQWGSTVTIYSPKNLTLFRAVSGKTVIDGLFRKKNRTDIYPETIKLVTLDNNVKAIALQCPEITEYFCTRRESTLRNALSLPSGGDATTKCLSENDG
jgi:hypothetical protein